MGQFQSTNFSFSGERAKKYQLIGPTLRLLLIKEKKKRVQAVTIEIGYKTKEVNIKTEKNIREQDGAPEIIDLIDTEKRGTTKIRSVS